MLSSAYLSRPWRIEDAHPGTCSCLCSEISRGRPAFGEKKRQQQPGPDRLRARPVDAEFHLRTYHGRLGPWAKLNDEWSQPNADKVVCGFKLGGLALSSANLAGGFYPDIKLPDCWFNGFNFALKSGEAIYQGKTVPVNELMFSTAAGA